MNSLKEIALKVAKDAFAEIYGPSTTDPDPAMVKWISENARRLVAALGAQEPVAIDWPDYIAEAMGCGLEDRCIFNRYDAMRYGWDEAIERSAERIPETIFAAPVLPSVPECEWRSDSDGSYYTGCGQYFTLNDGTPKENGMLFCHHCGGRLKIGDHDAEEVMTGCTPSPQEEK